MDTTTEHVIENIPENIPEAPVEPKTEVAPVEAKQPKAKAAKKTVKLKASKVEKIAKAEKSKKKPSQTSTREPTARQQKLLNAFGGKPKTLQELGDSAFPSESKARRNSWARNQVRWLLANKYIKKIKPGTYQKT